MFEVGSVVWATAGRDKHRFYAAVKLGQDEVFIADGKRRKLESPKRKNILHLRPTKTVLEGTALRTDKQLRLALAPFNGEAGVQKEQKEGTELV
ncbi:MAG: KOW domain-containing RNA-binding protein [Oscillospiraceae bacterium]|nr:KOW domain-containing RNA-binding protein [Oscillospiraceae bacterium]